MASYKATIAWERKNEGFSDNRYSRAHTWRFDGGIELRASSSPHVVPLPYSAEDAVDPEEAFVASLSSCHMLWFLSTAAKRGHCIDRYEDVAEGILARNAEGKLAMTIVTLRPSVVFSGDKLPTKAEIGTMHHEAHDACFIANSITTDVRCEPVFA